MAAGNGNISRVLWLKRNPTEKCPNAKRLTKVSMCQQFVENYPDIVQSGFSQTGTVTNYPRRTASDSRLDPEDTIAKQFNLLRVVDNERYPAFFDFLGRRYELRIDAADTKDN